METKIEVTETQLAKAFQLYNKDIIEHPDNYGESANESIEDATEQAKILIKFLSLIDNN